MGNVGAVSDEPIRRVPLPGHRSLTIRRAGPDDLPGLHRFYDALTADDRHARFFAAFRPNDAFLQRWVAHHVLVAVDDAGAIVADGGYARLANGDAEFALTIAPSWRGWLGPYLLDVLCADAAQEGIANLEGEILLTNSPMLAVVRTRGYAVVDHPDVGVVRVVFSTSGPAPSWPDATGGTGAGGTGTDGTGTDGTGGEGTGGSVAAGTATVGERGASRRPRLLVEGAGGRWRYEDEARAQGFDVITCPGPASRVGARRCPVLEGGRCPLVDGADVIVAALPPSDERSVRLRAAHADAGRTVVDAPPGDEHVLTALCALLAP